MVEFVPDTINQEAEESPDEERSSDVSITDVDEDSIEYLRRQVVEDSEEENKQDEVYQKVRKEFNERRAMMLHRGGKQEPGMHLGIRGI